MELTLFLLTKKKKKPTFLQISITKGKSQKYLTWIEYGNKLKLKYYYHLKILYHLYFIFIYIP